MIKKCFFKANFVFLVALLLCVGHALTAQTPIEQITIKLDSGDLSIEKLDRGDLALKFAMQAREIANASEEGAISDETLSRICLNTAVALKRLRKNEEAIVELYKLLELLYRENGNKYSQWYFFNLSRIAGFHLEIGQMEEAKKAFEKATEVAQVVGDDTYIASSYNNLGLYYERVEDYTEAGKNYELAMRSYIPDEQKDSILLVSIRDNIANLLLLEGKADSALMIVEPDYQLILEMDTELKRKALKGMRIASLYFAARRLNKVESILKLAGMHIKSSDHRWELKAQAELEILWVEYYKRVSRPFEVQLHYEKLDSLRVAQLLLARKSEERFETVISDYSISGIQSELSERSRKLLEVERTARINKLFVLIISCFSIFILITGFIFYRRKQALEKVQRELKQSEIERQNLINVQLQKDLSHKDKDFSDLIMRLTLKEDWVNDISTKLTDVIKESETVSAEEIKKVVRELKQQGGIHEKLDLYQSGIEDVNARFFAALEERFPSLTKSEKEICGLIRMNLDGKEIATIRSVDPASVRKMRQRIRKKLDITPDQDLYQFISAV